MAMGWGAVGGGAWGQPPARNYEEEEAEHPRPVSSNDAYGANSFLAQPARQPDLATTSQRSQSNNAGGFGSASGAYGLAAAGGQQSFNTAPGSSTAQAENAALKRKEAELAAKEKHLKELEAKLGMGKRKNWPICYPFLYHNISEEIPEKARRVVREGYLAWWGLLLCLVWNWFCTCVMLGQDVDDKVPSWFLAVLYLICGVPLSWWLWYRRLYNAAKDDSAFSFVWFFLWFTVHSAFCTWAVIAVPFSANKWSFAGFMIAMKAIDKNKFAGTVYFVGAGCWSALTVWSYWIIVDVFLFFRGKGGIKQAKKQAAEDAALAAFRQGVVNQA